jgi:hypothetical protein
MTEPLNGITENWENAFGRRFGGESKRKTAGY